MFEYIILAHNDIETRGILYEVLTNLGYKITTVVTHKELLEILKKEAPDYVILDLSICDMPPETVLEKIRIINENIKVIVLGSGKSRPETIQDILKILGEKRTSSQAQKETKELKFKANTLVVDDELECIETMKSYLTKKGYNVDTALNGEEAILKIKSSKPDIVFLDIRLPGMDGIIVLKAIKDIDKSIIVIMTSAIEDDKVIKEAIQLGANGYLVKPFDMSKLERNRDIK